MPFVSTGLRKTYRITYHTDREPTVVTTSPGDAALWESQNPGQSFINPPTVGKMMWSAWRAARRQNLLEDRKFEDWRDQVDEFELDDDDDEGEVDPTRTGA